jgi:crotonobetainyl-CoA:carnitine CoA-transferase CaiB-like acyl-CoA transferase
VDTEPLYEKAKNMVTEESSATAPLRGIKILDLTHGVAGPYAAMLLADLGADVWKVEKPGRGDPTRYMNVSSKFVDDIPEGGGDYFLAVNRNKQSIAIDLQSDDGRAAALKLVASADVVVSSFRPGVMDRIGLSYEDCQAVNPGVVYASLSAYGEAGPLAHQPGMDVAVQARSGVMAITGNTGSDPIKPGASIADFGGGSHFTIAILAALVRRATTGEGGRVHVSLLDAMMSLLSNYSVAVIDGEAKIGPMGSGHPQLVPFQAFPSQDGYIVIATGTNRLFRDLCSVLGTPELATDPRFRTNVDRVGSRAELVELISEQTRQRSTVEWLEIFEESQIPCAPVNTLDEAFAEEQLAAQGMIIEVDHPVHGNIHVVAAPYTFDSGRPEVRLPPPRLGEHTASILAKHGHFSSVEIARMQAVGAIGGSEAEPR